MSTKLLEKSVLTTEERKRAYVIKQRTRQLSSMSNVLSSFRDQNAYEEWGSFLSQSTEYDPELGEYDMAAANDEVYTQLVDMFVKLVSEHAQDIGI